MPPRHGSDLSLHKTPIAFPLKRAGNPQESVISQPSLTNLCRTVPSLTLTWRPTLMTSRCRPLLPASRRGGWNKGQPTSYSPGEVNGKQIAIHCSPEIQRDSVHFSRIPTNPGSTHKCELVTRWPLKTELLKSWASCLIPISTTALAPTIVSRELRVPSALWKPLLGLAGAFRPRRWWGHIRPSPHPKLCRTHMVHKRFLLPCG